MTRYLLNCYSGNHEELSKLLLLLPSRRACQAMREAFLTASEGKPLLLPRIQPIGDADLDALMPGVLYGGKEAIPPAMLPQRRLMLLARLIARYQERAPHLGASLGHALSLARALADLLDALAREQVPVERLRTLVPDDYAGHWQQSLDFLEIILTQWPRVLAEEGRLDVVTRRNLMLHMLANHWRQFPPAHPVIAAGTTGSIPATAELLATITRLPQGMVVLPGLDLAMEDKIWATLGPTHPQHGMKELLSKLDAARSSVRILEDIPPHDSPMARLLPLKGGAIVNSDRQRLLSIAMLPASVSEQWRVLNKETLTRGLEGLRYLTCETEEEEAGAVALLIREALAQPEKTVLVVTQDRALARRIAGRLRYWGIVADDSAGMPLLKTPPGIFLQLVMEAAEEDTTALPLLALLKHPWTRMGRMPGQIRQAARDIERYLLRRPRVDGGVGTLLAKARRMPEFPAEALEVLEAWEAHAAELKKILNNRSKPVTFKAMVESHFALAQALTKTPKEETLFAGWDAPDGKALLAALSGLMEESATLGALAPAQYAETLQELLAGEVFRPPYGAHPRVRILSPIEARLQQADVVILCGLNEGSWPAEPQPDPWLSLPMREQLGLAPHAQHIGQAAHDFFMLACAPEVVLTRARKQGGAPALPSRFLLRLEACMQAAGGMPLRMEEENARLSAWYAALQAPAVRFELAAPQFSPPLAARPCRIAVTEVETLLRDPYSYYARRILHLKALDAIERPLTMADLGIVVHRALERFVQEFPSGPLPESAGDRLLAIGRDLFDHWLEDPAIATFWWARFEVIAAWIIEMENERRGHDVASVMAEQRLSMPVAVKEETIELHGRLDRVERRRDGSLCIVDYKTGALPEVAEVKRGIACQLPLEALLACHSWSAEAQDLEYWHLTGGRKRGAARPAAGVKHTDTPGLIRAAEEGLHRTLTWFLGPAHPYLSAPVPEHVPWQGDYMHLARRKEWSG